MEEEYLQDPLSPIFLPYKEGRSHVLVYFLTRHFKSSYAAYVVNKEAAGSSGHL